MEEKGGSGIQRSWVFPIQSLKGNRILQLISAVAERETALMPPEREPVVQASTRHHGHTRFLDRDGSIPEYSVAHTASVEFSREAWLEQRDLQSNKLNTMPDNSNFGAKNFGVVLHEPSATQVLHIGPTDASRTLAVFQGPQEEVDDVEKEVTPKKKPKAKKARTKITSVKEPTVGKSGKNNSGVFINGITLDLSCIPVPVCSCTGVPQQCYKWGSGGWQSACCTKTLSMYPLPMSTKRRGARIAGRKMSRGAFKKVLEKLLSEGHSLTNQVDLRTYWAKHGTNKFVTIRLEYNNM